MSPNLLQESEEIDKAALRERLVSLARDRQPIEYRQLLEEFELRLLPSNVKKLTRALNEIWDADAARGLPVLAALVVRKEDGIPGHGFFEKLHFEPTKGPEARRRHRTEVQRTYGHWAIR